MSAPCSKHGGQSIVKRLLTCLCTAFSSISMSFRLERQLLMRSRLFFSIIGFRIFLISLIGLAGFGCLRSMAPGFTNSCLTRRLHCHERLTARATSVLSHRRHELDCLPQQRRRASGGDAWAVARAAPEWGGRLASRLVVGSGGGGACRGACPCDPWRRRRRWRWRHVGGSRPRRPPRDPTCHARPHSLTRVGKTEQLQGEIESTVLR